MKKYLKLILLILWLGIIYYFSSQDGTTSGNLSNGLLFNIASFINVQNIVIFVEKYGTIFRKLAHFIEYFVLAILLFVNFREYTNKDVRLIVVMLCALYATTDELHQLFVSGRAFALLDILIDSFGSFVGTFLIHLLDLKCFQEKKH